MISKESASTINARFLKSAFTKISLGRSDADVLRWLSEQSAATAVRVSQTTFSQLRQWRLDDNKRALRHESGRFFSIEGIRVETDYGAKTSWDQPIINQPEIGYLGCITKEFNGVLHFLLQAKIEPGNINNVQLSPTLQATRSNFSQVHKGKKPLFLEYFQQAEPHQILLDQLQSEQGARFLRKRNRNIVIQVDHDVPLAENHIWLTLGQIKSLMTNSHVINMDTRTVIAGLPYGTADHETISLICHLRHSDQRTISDEFLVSTLSEETPLNSINDIISKITHFKSLYQINISKVGLTNLEEWNFQDREIYRPDRMFFRVIPVEVEIGNREVVSWDQPMIEPAQEGLCAFVCKRIQGVLHIAMQLKLECGNHDVVELAPTVQTLTGDYKKVQPGTIPFLDYVIHAPSDNFVFDTLQSEEGGRFFKEQNRNVIAIIPDTLEHSDPKIYSYVQPYLDTTPPNFIWMTLKQLSVFIQFNNYLNIQARSLIAAVPLA